MVTIYKIITGKWKENCYIISSVQNKALIIDPGDESEKIIEHISTLHLKPVAILNTHAHYDHVGAVEDLKIHYQIPFYLHSMEKSNLKNVNLFRKMIDKLNPIKIPEVDKYVDKESNPLTIGEFEIKVLFTPGHSQGEICFLIENQLFSGDLLYKNKIGGLDFPGAQLSALKASLIEISKLPGTTTVYPGHGEHTTISEALLNNKEFIGALH